MITDYFSLALNNLKKRGLRSYLTMLGIFLGIAAVVSLISLGQGLQTAITGQFNALSTDTLTVTSIETGFGPPGSTAVRKLNENDLEIIKSVSGVKIAIPRIIRVAKVEYNEQERFRYLGSMPQTQEEIDAIYQSFNIKASQGRLLKAGDAGKIILGDDYIKENEFGKEIKIGSNIIINGKSFEVSGFLKRASTFIINSVVLMPEKDMKSLLSIKDEIDLIAVKVEDEKQIDLVAEEIERKLRKDRNEDEGEEDFSVQTPIQALESVSLILNIVNLIVAGIAGISLLIGGVGIANTMFTSVLERKKEIGIMKAIGAQNKDILIIFLIEAGLLGLVGGIIGIIIGLSLAYSVSGIAGSFLGDIDFVIDISLPLIIGSLAFSLSIGIISGIVPAYQASKLNPVDALRS